MSLNLLCSLVRLLHLTEKERKTDKLGGAGLIPYIGTAAATVGLAREAAIAAEGTLFMSST
jgi:hypothetical protein